MVNGAFRVVGNHCQPQTKKGSFNIPDAEFDKKGAYFQFPVSDQTLLFRYYMIYIKRSPPDNVGYDDLYAHLV